MPLRRAHIHVNGVVQGVGFRPFVFNLAERLNLAGWVLNDSGGVEIEVEGAEETIRAFANEIQEHHPPLARVEQFELAWLKPDSDPYREFEIRHSLAKAGAYQLVSPDVATCADCLAEVLDPTDRRYRYPFTNCTNCGPRFTIISDLPYDRPNTTMRDFPMCPDCQDEYTDPHNRRFHAQPNACPVCGPHLELVQGRANPALVDVLPPEDMGDVIARTAALLLEGAVVAIKGLGGYQLACDATSERAVAALRQRKQRPDKPFALMMTTLSQVRSYCRLADDEAELMSSPGAPIVLLERLEQPLDDLLPIAPSVAPDNAYLGVMLPYTPLHHILLRDVGRPLVMTSGNLTEEPIAAENDEALARLGPLCDALLMHNRGIYARYDDSVWFVADTVQQGRVVRLSQVTRRARGYAPFPVQLGFETRPVLACGPELKNTFCLTRDRYAFVSQHIGDMENLETIEHYERTLAIYQHLFDSQPEVVAVDLHPGYAATRFGKNLAQDKGLPLVEVQHHQAHIASCMADNGYGPQDGPVIGVALDGTGYGSDGRIWGGEWFVGGYDGFERVAHLEYLPLPGGDAATQAPWRIAAGYVQALFGEVRGLTLGVEPDKITFVAQQVQQEINAPLTSSMGRLFDAVAALAGLGSVATYEAQLAIALETAAGRAPLVMNEPAYPYILENASGVSIIRVKPLLQAVLDDVRAGRGTRIISRRFHAAVVAMTRDVCASIRQQTGLNTVALSGGCFQNRLLIQGVTAALDAQGFEVLLHRVLPANDGCISLGQAAIAALGMEH